MFYFCQPVDSDLQRIHCHSLFLDSFFEQISPLLKVKVILLHSWVQVISNWCLFDSQVVFHNLNLLFFPGIHLLLSAAAISSIPFKSFVIVMLEMITWYFFFMKSSKFWCFYPIASLYLHHPFSPNSSCVSYFVWRYCLWK